MTNEERAQRIVRPKLTLTQLLMLGGFLGIGSILSILGGFSAAFALILYWVALLSCVICTRFLNWGVFTNTALRSLLCSYALGLFVSFTLFHWVLPIML